jgi:CheY-like chemotaxis protein
MVGVRVLVAEDDEDVRHLVERLLTRAEVEVTTAVDGAHAIEVLGARPVHCLVLDVRMPGLGGLEVLRTLGDSAPEVPVVVLTGSAESRVRKEALDLGAAAVLPKPFEARELVHAVATAVHHSHPGVPLSPPLESALSG